MGWLQPVGELKSIAHLLLPLPLFFVADADSSHQPFIYDASKQLLISYEDQRSIALKGNFIHDQGLAGFAMWEAGGDKDDQLLDAISESFALRISPSAFPRTSTRY